MWEGASPKVKEALALAAANIEQSQKQEAENAAAAELNPPTLPTPDKFTEFENSICPLCKKRGAPVWFRIRPESAQAMNAEQTVKFRDAIRSKILEKYYREPSREGGSRPWNLTEGGDQSAVCVRLLFALAGTDKDKDVDNMAKAFLDAIKDEVSEEYGLIIDDSYIRHLSVEKYKLLTPPSGHSPNLNYIIGVKIALIGTDGVLTYQLAPPDSFEL